MSISPTPIASSSQASAAALAKANSTKTASKQDDKFSFWDLVDVVNPLQHIPIVNNIYRKVTGDEIGSVARVAGGAVFGGVIGALVGGVNAIAAHESGGKDLTEIAMNKMGVMGGSDKTDVAEAKEEAKPEEAKVATAPAMPTESGIPDALKRAAGLPVSAPVIEVRPLTEKIQQEKSDTEQVVLKNGNEPAIVLKEDKPIEVASAMPSPKELNDLEPGSIPAADPNKKVDINQSMMQALAKYQAMEKVAPPNTITTLAEGEKPAPKLFKRSAASVDAFRNFRHY